MSCNIEENHINCFLLVTGFGFLSFAYPGSFSAVSRVGLGCSVPFGPASHSKSFDLLCFAIALFICSRLLRLRTS
jgi:hypothetical protein